jgi:uncharacterized protein YbcI
MHQAKQGNVMSRTLSAQRHGASISGICTGPVEVGLLPTATSQRPGYPTNRSPNLPANESDNGLRTRGEIEASVCEFISGFQQDYMGRGPKSIRTHLIGELLVVRLQGVLTAAEQQLVKSHPSERGRDLLKQMRTHLVETARPMLESMVHSVTGVKVVSLHHDVSTVTGEEVMLFTLADAPRFRETYRK